MTFEMRYKIGLINLKNTVKINIIRINYDVLAYKNILYFYKFKRYSRRETIIIYLMFMRSRINYY